MPYVRSTDGCRIHYEVTGRRSSPPVLMIQGLGMDKHGWVLQRLAFSWRYRVIAFDNRGSGRSDKPRGRLRPVPDGQGCGRRARRRGRRAGARGRRVDGRGDRPDRRRDVPGSSPLAVARVHGVPQPAVAEGIAVGVGRDGQHRRRRGDGQQGGPLGDRAPIVPPHRARPRLARAARLRSVARSVRRTGRRDPRRRRHARHRARLRSTSRRS